MLAEVHRLLKTFEVLILWFILLTEKLLFDRLFHIIIIVYAFSHWAHYWPTLSCDKMAVSYQYIWNVNSLLLMFVCEPSGIHLRWINTPLAHEVACFQMLDFEISKSYSEVSKWNSWKITSFLKTTLLQREPFLTNLYTVNSSPLLITKKVFMGTIILSNYQ